MNGKQRARWTMLVLILLHTSMLSRGCGAYPSVERWRGRPKLLREPSEKVK